MEKFTPYEKLSKKKRRELDALRRGSWGALNPVTRKTANGKAYNRKKAQSRMKDSDFEPFPISKSVSAGGAGARFCGLSRSLFASPPLFRALSSHAVLTYRTPARTR